MCTNDYMLEKNSETSLRTQDPKSMLNSWKDT